MQSCAYNRAMAKRIELPNDIESLKRLVIEQSAALEAAQITLLSSQLEIEKLKIAKWYKDGAEQANIMLQEEALVAMSYSSDGYTFLQQAPDEFDLTVPAEGVAAWADWYFKIRGTHHPELADLFMNYLLEKETQDRVLANSSIFMARKDVAVPPHWKGYPASNEDYHRMFQVITMEGWAQLLPNWEAIDKRWKEAVLKTSS